MWRQKECGWTPLLLKKKDRQGKKTKKANRQKINLKGEKK
jgi:hypothetical protein